MPGTGTNHKSRPQSYCYRPARTSSTNQDESYKNFHNSNRDSFHNHYSEVPRPLLIDSAPAFHPPRYVNAEPGYHSDHDGYTTKPAQEPIRNVKPGQDSHLDPGPDDQPKASQCPDSPRDSIPCRSIVIDTQPSRHLLPSSGCGSCSCRDCRTLLCCVLTCGFYGRGRRPCAPPSQESSTDPLPRPELESLQPENKSEPRGTNLPSFGSFHYPDLRLNGRKVNNLSNPDAPPVRSRTAPRGESQRPISNTSIYSREDLDVDDVDEGSTDIDQLITRKLLELYKMHQIEQLAKCTSDQSFSRKTNEISDLIISIAQDYNLHEQEAECRLVHGVIRISTRKHAKNSRSKSQDAPLQPSGKRRDATLPDSGHDTMSFSFSNGTHRGDFAVTSR